MTREFWILAGATPAQVRRSDEPEATFVQDAGYASHRVHSMTAEFHDVIPVLPYRDIRAGHDYLIRVLGFASGGVVEDGAGKVVHAEVRAGDRRFWLHEATDSLAPPSVSGARSSGVVVHVADVDAHYERADRAGAQILRPPTDEDYGQREYGLRDCEGHDWYIATPLQEPTAR